METKETLLNKFIEKSPHLQWLENGLVYLVRSGSHSYGCNTPESDEDYKGITIAPLHILFSAIQGFDQAELKEPDATIYDLRKYFNLALNNNPNILELFWVDPEDQIYISPLGEKIAECRQDFLSKKCFHSYRGYAVSQIKRLELHRRWLRDSPKAPPTRAELGLPEQTLIPKDQLMAVQAAVSKELEKFNFDFLDGLSEDMKIGLKEIMAEMLASMQISIDDMWLGAARTIGLNDNLIEVMKREREYETKKRSWDQYINWQRTRNSKRFADEQKYHIDLKHAYHTVRLLSTCEEILREGKIYVRRPDRECLWIFVVEPGLMKN